MREFSLETIVHLGTGAFGEITGEVVNTVLFTWANIKPLAQHNLKAIRLVGINGSKNKEKALTACLADCSTEFNFQIVQCDLLEIANAPIVYWVPNQLLSILKSKQRLKTVAHAGEGFCTRDETRFVRYHWEVQQTMVQRWVPYSKGGAFCRWFGLMDRMVDFRHNGGVVIERIKKKYPYLHGNVGMLIKDTNYYFKQGLTYSDFGRGSLGVRLLPEGSIFSDTAPGIFPNNHNNLLVLAGLLNCRVNSYLIRTVCTGMRLPYRYVIELPLPSSFLESSIPLSKLVKIAIELKQIEEADEITSPSFSFSKRKNNCGILAHTAIVICKIFNTQALRHTVEGAIEEFVMHNIYCLGEQSVENILKETGTPIGWFPMVVGQEQMIVSEFKTSKTLDIEILEFFHKLEHLKFSEDELLNIKNILHVQYKAGPGSKHTDEEEKKYEGETKANNETNSTSRNPIPVETLLEELSQKLQIHPTSMYWLLKEGIEKDGWRCLSEERRITADRFIVIILRLLGHRWPKQIESGETAPGWANSDGIIPVTEGTNEPSLLARVRERIAADFEGGDVSFIEREFAEIMGKPLDQWLETEFFKHHTKQFKKRPIAWQIQSSSFTKRRKPAFACLLYYHKIDGDILPKIRTQYVGPLRQRLETELRGIETIPLDARSDRQEKRRLELQDLILELKDFDLKLQKTSTEGFACKKLIEIIKKEPVDKWGSIDGIKSSPVNQEGLLLQEQSYIPDINDGVRVNIVPLQKAGLLSLDVLAKKDIDKAIENRAEWRADERRWCREEKLPQPGWWRPVDENATM